jgi:protoporphyrinogen oxidase
MVLVTHKPLTPYYIVNIADGRIPFTGIIGMSNLVDPQQTAGMHVTFLPKYVDSTSDVLKLPDAELRNQFLAGLRLMFPSLDDRDIQSVHINRAVKVQPLQVVGYSNLVPRVESANPDFFVLNTAQFTHMTLNNNEVIRAVDSFVDAFGKGVTRESSSVRSIRRGHVASRGCEAA